MHYSVTPKRFENKSSAGMTRGAFTISGRRRTAGEA